VALLSKLFYYANILCRLAVSITSPQLVPITVSLALSMVLSSVEPVPLASLIVRVISTPSIFLLSVVNLAAE